MANLEERVAAAEIAISDDEFETLSAAGVQNTWFRLRRAGCGGVFYTVRARRSASSPANFAGSSGTPPSARRAVP